VIFLAKPWAAVWRADLPKVKQGHQGIIVSLDLRAQFFQQLFEQPGQVFFFLAAGQRHHEFVFHDPHQHQRQEPVNHNPGRARLIENKPFLGQAGCQLLDFISRKPARLAELLCCLRRLVAKGIYQVEFFSIVPDNGNHDGDGCITYRKLDHPLFADHLRCFFEFFIHSDDYPPFNI
jgi:hypothetical protein